MEKKINWDDIPTLEGVGVDWDFKPASHLGKRACVRIEKKDIPKLFAVGGILVKVATVKGTYTGRLLDLSVGGLAMKIGC